MKITEITGKITLADGSVSEFTIGTDGGWQQWGATTERLGQTTDALEAMARALNEDNLIVSDYDAEDEDDELQTWTFVGHWENGSIVVEYVLNGEHLDEREDTGYWEEGLFAQSSSGRTQDEALAEIRAEYEHLDD